ILKNIFEQNSYDFVLAEKQNWYPDISLISRTDEKIKFAIDIKTTYVLGRDQCNGFALGSHGEYFINKESNKNVQFPLSSYLGHYVLGVIYERKPGYGEDSFKIWRIDDLDKILSTISNFRFF